MSRTDAPVPDASAEDRPSAPPRRGWAAFLCVSALLCAVPPWLLYGTALLGGHTAPSAIDGDVDLQFVPWRAFVADELRAGRLPLWNPYNFGGVPALGNFQYAVLYPPNWLHLALSMPRALCAVVMLHVWLAGWTTAIWARSRGAGGAAAVLGGLLFALSGPYFMHVYPGHLPFLGAMAWAPLVLLAVDRLIDAPRALPAVLGGSAAVAMQVLTGYPQMVHATALSAGLYLALRAPWRAARNGVAEGEADPRRRRSAPRALGALLALYALAATLAAAQLLPAMEAGRESLRGEPLSVEFAGSMSLPPENLLTALAPQFFGDRFEQPYVGRHAMWEVSVGFGLPMLLLAAAGAARSPGRREIACLVVAGFAMIVALGLHTPVFGWLHAVVPGMDRFRVPARWTAIAALMLAALAARGWDRLACGGRTVPWGIAAGVVATGLMAGSWWLEAQAGAEGAWRGLLRAIDGSGDSWIPGGGYDAALADSAARFAAGRTRSAALFAAQVAALLLMLARVPRLRWALWLVIAGQTCLLAEPLARRTTPTLRLPEPLSAALPEGEDRALMLPHRWANYGTGLRYADAWGYDPSAPARWARLFGEPIGAAPQFAGFLFDPPRRLHPLLSMARVATAIPPAAAVETPPMPALALVGEALVVPSREASLQAVRAEGFDPRRTVVLEAEPSPAPQPGGTAGTVVLERRGTDAMDIRADLPANAILLITDAYASGWWARPLAEHPTQRRYDVLPANHALRAIPLAAGAHHLRLEYRPLSVPAGFAASGLGGLAWLAIAAIGHAGARRRG